MKFFEGFFKVVFVISVCAMFSISAAAYIDASMVTYGIQIGTGIVIAIGAAVGILIVKLKKKMKDKFNIDTDSKKEVEDEVVRIENIDGSGNNSESN